MVRCRICDDKNVLTFSMKTKTYVQCRMCGSICTDESCFENEESQRARYEKHHNTLSDAGYRTFLEQFIQPVLKEVTDMSVSLHTKAEIVRILDYGSGPEPALCELLKEYARSGFVLQSTCEIRGWDPFFAPDTAFFEEGADLVTCLEVAEHFEHPREDMKKLASACKSGGYVAIGTMLNPGEIEAFKSWWYRSDITHVAFYSLEGLIRCAENAGLSYVKALTDRTFLFRKKA